MKKRLCIFISMILLLISLLPNLVFARENHYIKDALILGNKAYHIEYIMKNLDLMDQLANKAVRDQVGIFYVYPSGNAVDMDHKEAQIPETIELTKADGSKEIYKNGLLEASTGVKPKPQPTPEPKPQPTPENKSIFADGSWYGMSADTYAFNERGHDVVKINIKDGKIVGADFVRVTEDITRGEQRGKNILAVIKDEFSKGIDLIKLAKIKEGVNNKKYNDIVSGATIAANSYVTAVEHALERSQKFQLDKTDQNIAYIELTNRKDTISSGDLNFDKALNFDFLKFNVFKTDGSKLTNQSLDDLVDIGFISNHKNGDLIPNSGKNIDNITLELQHKPSLTKDNIELVIKAKQDKKVRPSYILVSFADGSQKKFDIVEGEFLYPRTDRPLIVNQPISKVEIFENDKKLVDAKPVIQGQTIRYFIDLKNIQSESLADWEIKNYRLDTFTEDKSKVVKIEVKDQKTSYKRGEVLSYDDFKLVETTQAGFVNEYNLNQAKAKGYTINPDLGYEFSQEDGDTGFKIIKISFGKDQDLVETEFKVDVIQSIDNIPAKVLLKDGQDLIYEHNISRQEWDEKNGQLTNFKVEIPKKYENFHQDTFNIEAYNADGEKLDIKVTKTGPLLNIYFDKSNHKYLMIRFKFID